METKLILTFLTFLTIAICAISINNNAFCFELYRADRDIRGRVIDADTREPIQGVVVHAIWVTKTNSPAGPLSHFNDLHETITDPKGEFLIPGKGTKIMSNLSSPGICIFKAGYDNMGFDLKEEPKKNSQVEDIVTWEGDTAIILLKKLTMEERKERGTPTSPPHEAPQEKVILMLKEIDKERIELGLKPMFLEGR